VAYLGEGEAGKFFFVGVGGSAKSPVRQFLRRRLCYRPPPHFGYPGRRKQRIVTKKKVVKIFGWEFVGLRPKKSNLVNFFRRPPFNISKYTTANDTIVKEMPQL
jgi:hypothetical protein